MQRQPPSGEARVDDGARANGVARAERLGAPRRARGEGVGLGRPIAQRRQQRRRQERQIARQADHRLRITRRLQRRGEPRQRSGAGHAIRDDLDAARAPGGWIVGHHQQAREERAQDRQLAIGDGLPGNLEQRFGRAAQPAGRAAGDDRGGDAPHGYGQGALARRETPCRTRIICSCRGPLLASTRPVSPSNGVPSRSVACRRRRGQSPRPRRRTGAGDREQLWRESDFQPLEDQINLIVAESSSRILKLRSTLQTGRVMLEEVSDQLRKSVDVIGRDEARLEQVNVLLQARSEQTSRQAAGFLRGVEQACHEATTEGIKILQKRLSFWRTCKLIWGGGESPRDFQIEIEAKLKQTIQPQVEHAVRLLESDLRGIWPQLHDLIQDRLTGDLRNQIPQTTPDFARQRRELLQSIELALMERTAARTTEQLLTEQFGETTNRLRIPIGVAAAGGIATAIAAASSAAVADITGVVAISAATIGTVLVFTQRRKTLRAYEKQMKTKCAELLKAIEEKLQRAISMFYQELTGTFQPLSAFCVAQRRMHEPLLQRTEEVERQFESLKTRIG